MVVYKFRQRSTPIYNHHVGEKDSREHSQSILGLQETCPDINAETNQTAHCYTGSANTQKNYAMTLVIIL